MNFPAFFSILGAGAFFLSVATIDLDHGRDGNQALAIGFFICSTILLAIAGLLS